MKATALCVMSAVLAVATLAAQAPTTYAIRGARLNTISGPVIENGTVVIAEGRILSVGAGIPVPAGAEVIDGSGLEVTPGFFDSMSQLGLTEVGSVSGTVDLAEIGPNAPQAQTATAVNPASDHLPVARANGITHAVAAPGGGPRGALIAGQASAFHLDGWTMDDMQIERSVGMVVTWPSLQTRTFDPAAGGPRTRPFREAKDDQTRQLRDLARQIGDARDDRQARGRGGDRLARDLTLEALAPYASGERPWIVRANSERDIRDAVAFFVDQHKLRLVIAGGADAWKVAALLAEKRVPVILGPTQAVPASDDDPYDALYAAPGVLHKAGVPFALSTFNSSDARNLPYEIGTAVGYGLPREAALAAITLAPAQILGLADRFGSIEPGKVANLVVTRGDPLELRTTVTHVFVKGVPSSLETRHTQLYEKYRNRPKPTKD